MLVGYARVSTVDQTPALQLDVLRAAGCERVFEDTFSGSRSVAPASCQHSAVSCDWNLPTAVLDAMVD
jgi:hypothetical protein